jgi:hypothetical protein
METNANAHAEVASAQTATVTDLVVPVDLRQIASFTDLRVTEQSQVARKTELRRICQEAVDEEWSSLTPLLSPHGDFAGGAQFAHAIVAYRVYLAREESFDAIAAPKVTLRELWPLIHEMLKKRGLVFSAGFVTGMRR